MPVKIIPGNWGTMVRRVQEEVHRYDDDSKDRIKRAICHAVDNEQYNDYYFNESTYTFILTSGTFEYGQETSAGDADGHPADFLKIREMTLEVDGYVQWPIRAVPLRRFRKDQITSSYRGYPDRYSWDREKILFDPTPNGAYNVILDYTADIGTPYARYSAAGTWVYNYFDSSTGSDESVVDLTANAWFEEGSELILSVAKEYLYSNVFEDLQKAQVSRSHAEDERKRLRRESRASQTTSYPRLYF
jgi:hypothetical protein